MRDLAEVLEHHLTDWQAGWNVGSFGAIAEFHQDAGEPAEIAKPLERATSRGAIRIERTEDVRPVAWEALSKDPRRWQQGVALCLPEGEGSQAGRKVLTELGPDAAAIRPADREAILFDMGLDQRNIDFCVRTADPELIATLRGACGRALVEPGNPAMGAILAAHPHRVALSAIGRCEVFQKIGGPDTGGTSPLGPHTHVLPKLMAAGRTHSAITPVPDGWIPGMSLHPGSPVMTPLGEDRDFDPVLFEAFQALLGAWGAPGIVETKARVWSALDSGAGPEPDALAKGRTVRAARRIALRQRARIAGSSRLLAAWSEAHDRGAIEADDDMPGH
ncbi:MAG: hypothetical protein AAGE18_14360 [Pseudomonadota bacterium]